MLADIMHCAGKKGNDVSQVLERQLSRVGLNCYDVVAGTGDGGGEQRRVLWHPQPLREPQPRLCAAPVIAPHRLAHW